MDRRNSIALIALALALTALLSSCGWSGKPMDASGLDYKDEGIEIVGLTANTMTVTPAELAGLDCVDRTVKAENSYGSTITRRVQGPLLDTFLSKYGGKVGVGDISSVTFEATDGYKVTLDRSDLGKMRVVFGIMIDGKALAGAGRPLRIIMTNTPATDWIEGVNRVIFNVKET